MTFFNYLKNIFLLLLVLQLAPPILESIRKQWSFLLEPRTKVAVIDVKGAIYNADPYHKQLYNYFNDPSIKAILLKMDCPGGSSGSAQSIYQEILTLKKEHTKPIITLIENVCASGGYYIASATDYIIAPGSALVGSIGTSFPYLFKIKDFLDQFKIYNEPLKSGAYKDATNPFVGMSPEEKAMLQGLLDNAYKQFIHDVALCRKLSLATSATWADGKLFTAQQAQELGLIDAVGSPSMATSIIKEKALIEGEIEWIRKKEPSGFARMFGADDNEDNTTMFSSQFQSAVHYLSALLQELMPAAFLFAK